MVLTAESVDEILKWTMTQLRSAALTILFLIVSWKEVLSFESMVEILTSLLSCGSVYNAGKVVLSFEPVDKILKCPHSSESF